MEVSESVFMTFRKNRPYIHHSFCEEEEITHLCFADGLFILAHADVESIKTIKYALMFFSSIVDLLINEEKSLAFYGGVYKETKARIYEVMGIEEGCFPVRYLGISLTTRQIQIVHCCPLIEKKGNGFLNGSMTFTFTIEMIHIHGSHSWEVEEDGKLISSKVWDAIRERGQVGKWDPLVWSSKIAPRHQFILRLAFRGRLNTRDRVMRYMEIPDISFLLCEGNEESIDHLFVGCLFDSTVWRRFALTMGMYSFSRELEEIKVAS
ncbi:uncharacterized protein LOC124939347 [Impatiens glandulifera]|uniref:uncharacterized protein LOC124939347 n=1 Tax=Impatiens glandulifera TaxID=253017 RepID=UPI001FB1672F|nr:uncharacterized protein LOC124939347 [Impatiens glandulifera]